MTCGILIQRKWLLLITLQWNNNLNDVNLKKYPIFCRTAEEQTMKSRPKKRKNVSLTVSEYGSGLEPTKKKKKKTTQTGEGENWFFFQCKVIFYVYVNIFMYCIKCVFLSLCTFISLITFRDCFWHSVSIWWRKKIVIILAQLKSSLLSIII